MCQVKCDTKISGTIEHFAEDAMRPDQAPLVIRSRCALGDIGF